MTTSTLNVRIDQNIKKTAYKVLEELDVTPTEAIRLYFEYIAQNRKLPIKTLLVSEEEDADLIEITKQRLDHPLPSIKVDINDL